MSMGNQVGTSTTPLATTGTATTSNAAPTTGLRQQQTVRTDGARETKPFYRTSEFIVFIAMTAVVLVAGYSNRDSLDLFRTWMLATILGSAYIVSRGLAKAGAREGTREIDLR